MAKVSAEKLGHIGPAEKERVASTPQRKQLANNDRAAFAKRKRNRAIYLKHQILRGERVKMSKSRILARKRKIRTRALKEKDRLHSERQVPRT